MLAEGTNPYFGDAQKQSLKAGFVALAPCQAIAPLKKLLTVKYRAFDVWQERNKAQLNRYPTKLRQ
jgi:hypothetical protein